MAIGVFWSKGRCTKGGLKVHRKIENKYASSSNLPHFIQMTHVFLGWIIMNYIPWKKKWLMTFSLENEGRLQM